MKPLVRGNDFVRGAGIFRQADCANASMTEAERNRKVTVVAEDGKRTNWSKVPLKRGKSMGDVAKLAYPFSPSHAAQKEDEAAMEARRRTFLSRITFCE